MTGGCRYMGAHLPSNTTVNQKLLLKKIYYNTHALTLKTAGAERHTQLGYCRHQKTVIKRSLIGHCPLHSFWIQFKERHRKPCSGIISKWKGKQRNKRQSDKHLLSGEYFPQDTYFSSFMTYSLTPGIYQLHFSCVYHFYSGLVQLPDRVPRLTQHTTHIHTTIQAGEVRNGPHCSVQSLKQINLPFLQPWIDEHTRTHL